MARTWLIALGLAVLTTIPGCWDSRELDEQVHVLSGYLDLEDDGMVRLTVEALSLMSAGEQASGTTHTILTARGPSPGEAAWQMIWMSEGDINWVHTGAMYIGEALARRGLAPIIDSLLEPYDLRRSMYLTVVPGKAVDLLSAQLIASRHSEQTIGMLRNAEIMGAFKSSLNGFIKDLSTEGIDPAARRFILTPPPPVKHMAGHAQAGGMGDGGGGEPGGGADSTEPGAPPVEFLDGMAIFREDRLVGFLEQRETYGIEWLMAPIRGRHIWVPVEESLDGIGLWVYNTCPRIEVEETAGGLVVNCGVAAEADIEEMLAAGDLATPADVAAIEALTAQHIEAEMLSGLAYVIEWGADTVGFGRYLARHHPDVWDRYREDWPSALRQAKFVIDIDVSIVATGMLRQKQVTVPDGKAPK